MQAGDVGAALLALLLTASATAAQDPGVRLVVVSDLNGSYGTVTYPDRIRRAVERIIELEPDVVLVTGDMIAGQRISPKLTQAEIESMWKGFHEVFTDPLADAGVQVAVTPGNHDGSAAPGFENERAEFARQWRARRPGVSWVDDEDYPFDYAFRVGPTLVVSLEGTLIEGPTTSQLAWLDGLLASRRRDETEIVFSHLPLVSFTVGREHEVFQNPEFGPLLEDRGVEVHLSGHHHAFYAGVRNGVTHVSQASLGSGPRRLLGDEARALRGFTLIEIDRDGHARIESLVGPDFRQALDPTTLPRSLATGAGPLVRFDLARGAGERDR